MGLQQRQAGPVVAVVGVDVGVQGTGVDDDRYRAASRSESAITSSAACSSATGSR
jgi:hypothetical protein